MMTEQKLKKILGRNVKIRREERVLSQEKLAEKVDVSKNAISDIETGQKFATAKTLAGLANALDTQVYELLKPDNVKPDSVYDVATIFSADVIKAVEKIGNEYKKKLKR
jgi:transcriptional regulator with XRE-family HTH domain